MALSDGLLEMVYTSFKLLVQMPLVFDNPGLSEAATYCKNLNVIKHCYLCFISCYDIITDKLAVQQFEVRSMHGWLWYRVYTILE